jgi:hypothetical protein
MASGLIRILCLVALRVSILSACADAELRVSPRLNSEAAGLNISHPDLPGNIFDFRTCETVLDGNRDFGLFLVKLTPPGTARGPTWSTNAGRFSYEWTYEEGITVRFEATPRAGYVAVAYTIINRTATPLERVHLHTCVTTTEAPAFFPPLTSRIASQLPAPTPDKDYTELLTRLFLWSDGRAFPLSATEYGRRQVHLSLMPKGEAPIQWAWWVNSTNTFDEPLIALASRDGQWTAGLWFERAVWASSNAGDDRACFHLFPLFGRIEPGASATVHGAFHLQRGGPEELRQRANRRSQQNRAQPSENSPSSKEMK